MKFKYFLISIFAFGLTSCASNCKDFPRSVSQELSSDIQKCNGLTKLAKGDTCSISVSAEDGVETGIYVKAGQEYRIEMPENQVWYDCSIRVPLYPKDKSSLCGIEGTETMNRFSFLKKESDSDWFSVIAEIESDGINPTYDLCKLSEKPNNSSKITANKDGNILLYPNDAYFFYSNNSGNVWLIIHRLK